MNSLFDQKRSGWAFSVDWGKRLFGVFTLFCNGAIGTFRMEAIIMSGVLSKLAEHTQIDQATLETELFAALRALEIDPETMTIEELRQCLMLYLDQVFFDITPDKVH